MIIFLNGPINSGKTTVGRLLASRIPKAIHLEVDDLPCGDIRLEQAIPLLLDDTILLTRQWVARGFSVIVSWPIAEADYRRFVVAMDGQRVHAVTLSPPLEVALTNRGHRELTAWELQRIRYHYGTGLHCPKFGRSIDNSALSPSQTVDAILAGLPDCASPAASATASGPVSGRPLPRAPLQVLVFPYRLTGQGAMEYAIFHRSDGGYWQGIAGGAEAGESPMEAARREAKEEAGIPGDAPMLSLDCCCAMPVIHFKDRAAWGADRYVVPEHCFGVLVSTGQIVLSAEHQGFRWVSYDEAMRLLHFDSNKTALWELNERLMRGSGPKR